MDNKVIFWALIITCACLLMAIYAIGNAIKVLVKTDAFKQKLDNLNRKEQARKLKNGIKSVAILIGAASLMSLSPAEGATKSESVFYSREAINILLFVNIALVGFLIYYRNLFRKLYNIDKTEEDVVPVTETIKKKQSKLTHILTDTVAIEDEASILMDHDYDGIQELDNNLPPWWKWGLYISIVAGIIYIFNYHIIKISPLQTEEYEISMHDAQVEIDAYLKDQALNVDENSVVILTDASDIAKGEGLFNQYCTVCHAPGGAGDIGPNLTDNYWLYSGTIQGIFKTVKYGAQNGMKSWKDELNPVQIQQVSSYITTLNGTNPPNPKEPEGKLAENTTEVVASDSTALVE